MRRLFQTLESWGWAILLVGAGSVTALLNGWRPWEIVALAAVLGVAGAAIAAVSAWQEVRTREIELTALTSDDQAARLLGEALHKFGAYLPEQVGQKVWEAFNALSSEQKRALALAVVGFVGDSESYQLASAGSKLLGIAQGFHAAPPATVPAVTSDEQAAHMFGAALGRCYGHLSEAQNRESWDRFAALAPPARRELAGR